MLGGKMTLNEFVSVIQKYINTGATYYAKPDVKTFLSGFAEAIEEILEKDETFSWHGVGRFKTAIRKGRKGVSVLTGTPYDTTKKVRPVLVFSEVFRDKINNAHKTERNNENEDSETVS